MATEPQNLPAFPRDLPLADIAVISYKKILDHNQAEELRALDAVKRDGFFYLSLIDSAEGQELIAESNRLLKLSEQAFSSPEEEKMEYRADRGRSIFGYKPAGTVKATDKDQRPDTTEFFNISKDHLFGNGKVIKYLPRLEESSDLLRSFAKHCHDGGRVILRSLARSQGVPENSYADKNPFDSLSGDHIRLTKKPPHSHSISASNMIGLPSHTDFGSVTVLFNWLGGLQIQSHDPARKGEWNYVKPSLGHAIINLGDAMVKFSNGTLKSAKHRVVPSPGEQGSVDRYSVVYFVRPADHVIMEPIEELKSSEVIQVGGKVGEPERMYTAGEWNLRRIQQLASATS
jgi:isopenicillin N synthase-like dioxygenase